MRRSLGIVCMLLGIVLLGGAIGLLVMNRQEAEQAEQASAELMPQLDRVIRENSAEQEPDDLIPGIPPEMMDPEDRKMTEAEIDGNSYIGYLAIPALGLELPVMADWDYEKLRISPCRFCGTTIEQNLVVIAHNYRRHFGTIDSLQPGDAVIFVDMDSITTHYEVVATDVVDPNAVEEVTSGDFALTLVTCTYGGQTRVVVYCDEVEQ